ncbi:MAG TPA: NAD(P)-dependent oxidoreductase [Bryobacteraceae bacterium]|jgi:3-hydroxyisobutyrate dehydrogenase-like beta-hydroxyacid dehydrogenase
MPEPSCIGLLGVGLAGSAIAKRLLAAGYSLCAFDPAMDTADRVEALGASWRGSEREVAADCRCIVLSLPGPAEVRGVMDAIVPVLRAGDLILDTTTGRPSDVDAIAASLSAKGVGYLDATLGGSSSQIARGEAIVICGAEDADFARANGILLAISDRVFHTGPPGSGTRMKLVINMAIGLHRAVLGEALAFARSNGIDPEQALEVLKSGPAYSRVMDTKGAKMVHSDFTPEARLAQHWKDVRLMLECAEQNGASVPLTRVHDQLLAIAVESGWGAEDNSAIAKVFWNGSS